jgi:hypothetical protein
LGLENLIFVGDLNFTLSAAEIWGASARSDHLASFFDTMLLDNELIDVAPGHLSLTWMNGRMGTEGVSKRLDRYLLSDNLFNYVRNFRTWVDSTRVSDHSPIILQIESVGEKTYYPFKLNAIWLEDPGFKVLVRDHWTGLHKDQSCTYMSHLVNSLKLLKIKVK